MKLQDLVRLFVSFPLYITKSINLSPQLLRRALQLNLLQIGKNQSDQNGMKVHTGWIIIRVSPHILSEEDDTQDHMIRD